MVAGLSILSLPVSFSLLVLNNTISIVGLRVSVFPSSHPELFPHLAPQYRRNLTDVKSIVNLSLWFFSQQARFFLFSLLWYGRDTET